MSEANGRRAGERFCNLTVEASGGCAEAPRISIQAYGLSVMLVLGGNARSDVESEALHPRLQRPMFDCEVKAPCLRSHARWNATNGDV